MLEIFGHKFLLSRGLAGMGGCSKKTTPLESNFTISIKTIHDYNPFQEKAWSQIYNRPRSWST